MLPDKRVRVRVTPAISWFSADAAGVIEVTQASVELVVANGRPVQLGGARTTLHGLTREILRRPAPEHERHAPDAHGHRPRLAAERRAVELLRVAAHEHVVEYEDRHA